MPLRSRLVSSLIFPLFDYCAALYTDLTGQQRLKLRRLMNACVRFVYGLRKDEHVSHLYRSLGWLSADDRKAYLLGCLIFSILSTGDPSYLAGNLQFHTSTRSATRASPHDLALPACRTSVYQHSFSYVAPSLWNTFPDNIRLLDFQTAFRRQLFRHLRGDGSPEARVGRP